MTKAENNGGRKHMHGAVRLREMRSERWKQEGERSIWKNISMIGALGWLIVTPILLCTFIGRWLDKTLDTGVFWSGAFIFVGVLFGGYLAWQRIHKE